LTRRFDLVAFDVDGTLVHHPEDKTVWEVLNHRFTGSDDQNARWDLYRRGKLSYAQWVALDIASWRDAGATRETIAASFGALTLVEGARETLGALKSNGVRLAVISGTLDLLLDTLFPDHPFDEVYTNRIVFDADGRIAHWHATPFDMDGKGVALRSIALREDLPLSRCAFVGDHANDPAYAGSPILDCVHRKAPAAAISRGTFNLVVPQWTLPPASAATAACAAVAGVGDEASSKPSVTAVSPCSNLKKLNS
jgi:HAD superfamily phosphoserine phosphatase-like hydrolase